MFQITLYGDVDEIVRLIWNVIQDCKEGFCLFQMMAFRDRVQVVIDNSITVEFIRERFSNLGYSVEVK